MLTGKLCGILIVAHHTMAQTPLFNLMLAWTCLVSVYTAVFSSLYWKEGEGGEKNKTPLDWIPFLRWNKREWKIGILSPEMLQKLRLSSLWQSRVCFRNVLCPYSFLIKVDGGREKYYYILSGTHLFQSTLTFCTHTCRGARFVWHYGVDGLHRARKNAQTVYLCKDETHFVRWIADCYCVLNVLYWLIAETYFCFPLNL